MIRNSQLARRSMGMEKSTRVPTTYEISMIRVDARIGMLTSWNGSTEMVSRMRSVTA